MGKAIKLLALDMDGTLLNGKGEISGENARWIRRAADAGITVVLATGRGFVSAAPYAEQLGLKTPMVLVNGGEVRASPDRIVSRTPLETRQVKALRETALRLGIWYWGYGTEAAYNRDRWPEDEDGVVWLKFGFYSEDEAALAEAAAAAREIGPFEMTNSHPNNIELNPPGVSKASGLRRVCEMLGIGMDETAACGDSLNDIAMLREAGLGVAMGNAQEPVKRVSDAVTLTNDEDGVAHMIRKYILRE